MFIVLHIKFKGGYIFTIYERMLSESKRLEEQIKLLQARISTLPPGHLVCSHNANRYKWYHSDGHHKHYIPKSNRKLAEQLAAKKYLSLLLNELSHEKRAIEFYLQHHNGDIPKSNLLLTEHEEYSKLLSPYFSSFSQELIDWMNAPFISNPKYPEHLIHKSSSGHLLRSKSEAMIDTFLYLHKIPFRYECALTLGDLTIFPDFTIRHPVTGKTYYWEHFGLITTPNYAQKAFEKQNHYVTHGIIPSIQLITTYESPENPLSSETIEKIISHYFL